MAPYIEPEKGNTDDPALLLARTLSLPKACPIVVIMLANRANLVSKLGPRVF